MALAAAATATTPEDDFGQPIFPARVSFAGRRLPVRQCKWPPEVDEGKNVGRLAGKVSPRRGAILLHRPFGLFTSSRSLMNLSLSRFAPLALLALSTTACSNSPTDAAGTNTGAENGITGGASGGTIGSAGKGGATSSAGTAGANGVTGTAGAGGATSMVGTDGAMATAGVGGAAGMVGAMATAGAGGAAGMDGSPGAAGTTGLGGASGVGGAGGAGGEPQLCGQPFDAHASPSCVNCLEESCCDVFDPCYADAACRACLNNENGPGCATNASFTAYWECANQWAPNKCGPTCKDTPVGICGTAYTAPTASCETCINANCCSEFHACAVNSTCLLCLNNADGLGCSSANGLYEAYFQCTNGANTDQCGDACDATLLCGLAYPKAENPACDTCINANCCDETDACAADASCLACLDKPDGAGCATNPLVAAYRQCFTGMGTGECGAPCLPAGFCSSHVSISPTCDACLSTNCCGSYDACNADATCSACLDDSTQQACTTSALLGQFMQCFGGTGANQCGASCGELVCGLPISEEFPACTTCMNAHCCGVVDPCYADATCRACFLDPFGAGCDTNALYAPVYACMAQSDADQCGQVCTEGLVVFP